MVGIPTDLLTREDWYNAVDYVKSTNDGKGIMIDRLNNLMRNTKILVLKKTSEEKPAEEQTPDDFELVDDPNSDFARLAFTKADIENLIRSLT